MTIYLKIDHQIYREALIMGTTFARRVCSRGHRSCSSQSESWRSVLKRDTALSKSLAATNVY